MTITEYAEKINTKHMAMFGVNAVNYTAYGSNSIQILKINISILKFPNDINKSQITMGMDTLAHPKDLKIILNPNVRIHLKSNETYNLITHYIISPSHIAKNEKLEHYMKHFIVDKYYTYRVMKALTKEQEEIQNLPIDIKQNLVDIIVSNKVYSESEEENIKKYNDITRSIVMLNSSRNGYILRGIMSRAEQPNKGNDLDIIHEKLEKAHKIKDETTNNILINTFESLKKEIEK